MTAATDDGTALLAAILAHPEEDTPRLMYADWLEEHGKPERAEFIRARGEAVWVAFVGCYNEMFNEIRAAHSVRFCGFGRHNDDAKQPYLRFGWFQPGEGRPRIEHNISFYFDRGFAAAVRCPAAWWLLEGDAIRERYPVTSVTLTTWPNGWAIPSSPADAWRKRVTSLLCEKYPGVEFTLPG